MTTTHAIERFFERRTQGGYDIFAAVDARHKINTALDDLFRPPGRHRAPYEPRHADCGFVNPGYLTIQGRIRRQRRVREGQLAHAGQHRAEDRKNPFAGVPFELDPSLPPGAFRVGNRLFLIRDEAGRFYRPASKALTFELDDSF